MSRCVGCQPHAVFGGLGSIFDTKQRTLRLPFPHPNSIHSRGLPSFQEPSFCRVRTSLIFPVALRLEISLIVEEMIHAAQSAFSSPQYLKVTTDQSKNMSKWMIINNETTNTVWSMAKEMETAFTKDNIYVQVLWLASSMAGEGMM